MILQLQGIAGDIFTSAFLAKTHLETMPPFGIRSCSFKSQHFGFDVTFISWLLGLSSQVRSTQRDKGGIAGTGRVFFLCVFPYGRCSKTLGSLCESAADLGRHLSMFFRTRAVEISPPVTAQHLCCIDNKFPMD